MNTPAPGKPLLGAFGFFLHRQRRRPHRNLAAKRTAPEWSSGRAALRGFSERAPGILDERVSGQVLMLPTDLLKRSNRDKITIRTARKRLGNGSGKACGNL